MRLRREPQRGLLLASGDPILRRCFCSALPQDPNNCFTLARRRTSAGLVVAGRHAPVRGGVSGSKLKRWRDPFRKGLSSRAEDWAVVVFVSRSTASRADDESLKESLLLAERLVPAQLPASVVQPTTAKTSCDLT